MGSVKQIDIKNRTYYFYNDMVDIKKSDSNLLKIDKKSHQILQMKIKRYLKNKVMLLMKLETKSKK